MNAIIYAAGRATRLGAAHAHLPKVLLEFGGRTLLEWHALRLAEAGVCKLTVVTGHCREPLAREIPRVAKAYGLEIHERFNPDFCEGSVISLMTSFPDIDASPGGFLLMDGDVLYDRGMLERLIASPHRSALLVDFTYSTADDDPVLVPVLNGRPFEFQKRWRGTADRVGESVGFFKISSADVPLLKAETLARSTGLGRLDSMDEVIRALVRAGCLGLEDITGTPWTEIDFPTDVAYARERILPQISGVRAEARR